MNGKALLLAVLVLLGTGLMVMSQSTDLASSSVLLLFPSEFHEAELVVALEGYAAKNADIYLTSVDTLLSDDADRLGQMVPPHLRQMPPNGTDGHGLTVLPFADALNMSYDIIDIRGAGWSTAYYDPLTEEPLVPSFAPPLYGMMQQVIDNGGVIGGVGPGIHAIVDSQVLPQQASVPAYPCDWLLDHILRFDHNPIVAQESPREDELLWPNLVEAEVHKEPVKRASVVMLPTPTSWYPPEKPYGEQYVGDYYDEIQDYIDDIEYYHLHPEPRCDVRIVRVDCGVESTILLRNETDQPIDLTGWKLRAVDKESGLAIQFLLDGNVIEPGGLLEIYAGTNPPPNAPESQVWSMDSVFGIYGELPAVLINPEGFEESKYDCKLERELREEG